MPISHDLGDNCIKNFHLGRYIVGYQSEILFYGNMSAELLNMISNCIYDDIPPQIKILNIVFPILMCFLTSTHQKHTFWH